MTISATLTLLDRLADGPRERRELFGLWARGASIALAVELGWVTVGDTIAITARGRRALDGQRRWISMRA